MSRSEGTGLPGISSAFAAKLASLASRSSAGRSVPEAERCRMLPTGSRRRLRAEDALSGWATRSGVPHTQRAQARQGLGGGRLPGEGARGRQNDGLGSALRIMRRDLVFSLAAVAAMACGRPPALPGRRDSRGPRRTAVRRGLVLCTLAPLRGGRPCTCDAGRIRSLYGWSPFQPSPGGTPTRNLAAITNMVDQPP